ncbi:hypothetical protein EJ05DRAFT_473961 [Pseudovirgaria hyperparasitica]|uniref:Uncharacterized protein n=1 Tax=Pseudovirgaria hyperparasitica TaxID=470096 RepID=A0A6A6WF63_9PEZI|nr:uncharacterized protein EJ05DRAFT_473961 [Pseudovirgaria hyperparasitica]KAF2761462.1 hypothetical protein EJ05DRAFT_473961 [Pseudovirgaria hyperparasitica]
MPSRSRSRSRSPHRSSHRHRSHRDRSTSPRRHSSKHHSHHSRHDRKRKRSSPVIAVQLPLRASPISKDDFIKYRNVFALYLDVQKQLLIEDLPEQEVRGRWKSFVKKWNSNVLAEGWYDPETHAKANASAGAEAEAASRNSRESPPISLKNAHAAPEESDDSDIGPALPDEDYNNNRTYGPALPSRQDLRLRDEMSAEEAQGRMADLRYARKQDRAAQKERLEELVPRADPGSRERQLEKKRETTAANRSFREAKSPGAEEVGDGDLLGDDADAFKARKKADERKKTEREIRREELNRARAAEWEEKMAEHRAKEDKTMAMLKAIAKERFG